MANLPYFGLFQLSPFSPKALPLLGVCAVAPWQLLLVWACRAAVRQQSETRRDAHGEASRPPRASRRAGGTGLVAGREQKKGTSAPCASQLPGTDAPKKRRCSGCWHHPAGGLCTPHRPEGGAGGAGLSLPALHQEQTPIGPAVVENQELQAILNELSK